MARKRSEYISYLLPSGRIGRRKNPNSGLTRQGEAASNFYKIARKAYTKSAGLEPTGSKARDYRATRTITLGSRTYKKGDIVSRRQAEQHTSFEGQSFEELAKRRAEKTGGHTKLSYARGRTEDFIEEHFKRTGEKLGFRQAQRSEEFRSIIKDLKTKSRAHGSRKEKALIALGRRDSEWTHRVGDTPKVIG